MADERRSNLIDVTYTQVLGDLRRAGVDKVYLKETIAARKICLQNATGPSVFGRPNPTSRQKVEKDSLVLPDGVEVTVGAVERQFAFGVSAKFNIDEVQAYILFRAFLYMAGAPTIPTSTAVAVSEMVDSMEEFYNNESVAALQLLAPLFRAWNDPDEPLCDVSADIVPAIAPDSEAYAKNIVDEYLRRTTDRLATEDPRKAIILVKRNLNEQLGLLQLLYAVMWNYVPRTGPVVVKILKAVYGTVNGMKQQNETLMLDDESQQMLRDCAVLWILISVEVLELEEVPFRQLSETLEGDESYFSSPTSLEEIHRLVTENADSRFACTYLAWAYVLANVVAKASDAPESFRSFIDTIKPSLARSYNQGPPEPVHIQMCQQIVTPEAGLFTLLHDLLTKSPVLVVSVSWSTGSAMHEPNALCYRATIKGLVLALLDLVSVELIPDYDGLVDVWTTLFGRSETSTVASLCSMFWQYDHQFQLPPGFIGYTNSAGVHSRRALLDVARHRFPMQLSPLLKILRAMSGSGFLDTDPLAFDSGHPQNSFSEQLSNERLMASRFVSWCFKQLPNYACLVPLSKCSGPHALYERVGGTTNSATAIMQYTNVRAIKLPGGSILPARSVGTVISGDSDSHIIVTWKHQHSGWKLILEVLAWYVNRRYTHFKSSANGDMDTDDIFTRRNRKDPHYSHNHGPPLEMKIDEIGMELNEENDEEIVTDALDLLRSVIQYNHKQVEELMTDLEQPTEGGSTTPDLVQLTTMILEEALSRSGKPFVAGSRGEPRNSTRMKLITSSLSVLAALLSSPSYSTRVWLYIRSSSALFGVLPGTTIRGPSQEKTYASTALAMERASGQYTVTLAVLLLIQRLMWEAALTIRPDAPDSNANSKLQQVKEEVLLRAIRFMHNEIWIEHLGWRYNQLGDRFEIVKKVLGIYLFILTNYTPSLSSIATVNQKGTAAKVPRPYSALAQAVLDILLLKATTSTITPLVSAIANGKQIARMLDAAKPKRYGDYMRQQDVIQLSLTIARQILITKLRLQADFAESGRPAQTVVSLLEQALCARVIGGNDASQAKQDPIEVLTDYVKDNNLGPDVPYAAIRLLTTLGKSLSLSSGSSANTAAALALTPSLAMSAAPPTTMIGHLANPEAVVKSLVGIVEHPFDDPDLRVAIWKFIALVVDVEPALGGLFVAGKFKIPANTRLKTSISKDKGKGKEGEKEKEETALAVGLQSGERNALSAAKAAVSHWKVIWDHNPQLLSAALQFLAVVWEHALEHKVTLKSMCEDPNFWACVVSLVKQEIGPVPDYETTEYDIFGGLQHSNHEEAVAKHAYQTLSKAYAVHLLSLDIGFHLQSDKTSATKAKPASFAKLEPELRSEDDLSEMLSEAAPSPYAPRLYDDIAESFKRNFPGLTLEQLESSEPLSDRMYGDRFAFSLGILQDRLAAFARSDDVDGMNDPADAVTKSVLSINLNLSLTHAQTTLTESWEKLLRQSIPFLRGDAKLRKSFMKIAVSISGGIALETREGEMMASIHGARLALLLAILEVAWFSSASTPDQAETKLFLELARNVRRIVNNEAQAPVKSFTGSLPNPFHRTVLQLLFFYAKEARLLLNRRGALNSDQRLELGETTEAALNVVIDGLRITFMSAQNRRDIDLDRDLELLVSVFDQCTKTDITPSSTYWLSRCQETDVMRASLELFVRTDLSGLSDVPLLLTLKHPLYSPHLFVFHMAVVSNLTAAERLASEGLLSAYSSNSISAAISTGQVDVAIPELSGERSPVHMAYCSMLSVVATVITALGRHNHYFDAEACGFVQLYGDQISRALSWTIGDPITMPLMEEMEQVVNLFYAIAASVPNSSKPNVAVEKVLRVFTTHALLLLQQLNYAITHPNHLASLFEPISVEERTLHEKTQGIADPFKRPLVARLVHRMFRLSSNIVGTLVSISKADTVLMSHEEDWPLGEALVVPHSKVVVGEPASLGTLLELANSSLDILRDFVNRPANQALTPDTPTQGSHPLDVRQAVITARRNLETVLLYAVTQLAMWLSKPDFEPVSADSDNDEAMDTQRPDTAKERRMIAAPAARSVASVSMAERLRRGMTGEMASDLAAVLSKAKAVVAKSDAVIGKECVDVMQILNTFLHDRIISAKS